MAGIYLHIPFCKQACYYCNFHFSTLLNYKEKISTAIGKELFLRAHELDKQPIETIYFGGGTPSLLSDSEMKTIWKALEDNFDLSQLKEVTLEANPDDLNKDFFEKIMPYPINRLSVGIQSFREEELRFMNRAHNAIQARDAVKLARDKGYHQLSIDLIYGIPISSHTIWEQNIEEALKLEVPHISAYCLTIEPDTVFGRRLRKKQMGASSDEFSAEQYSMLCDRLAKAGYEAYEISNLSLPGAHAVHNTSYWKGASYLGVGPSAHSYLPGIRKWNVANNHKYASMIESGKPAYEEEILSTDEQFNELVMTSLRTMWGLDLEQVRDRFGPDFETQLLNDLKPYLESGQIIRNGEILSLEKKARFLADGIAASAFRVAE